jgi:hypothetical protein
MGETIQLILGKRRERINVVGQEGIFQDFVV